MGDISLYRGKIVEKSGIIKDAPITVIKQDSTVYEVPNLEGVRGHVEKLPSGERVAKITDKHGIEHWRYIDR